MRILFDKYFRKTNQTIRVVSGSLFIVRLDRGVPDDLVVFLLSRAAIIAFA
jgi:hypothetical protein